MEFLGEIILQAILEFFVLFFELFIYNQTSKKNKRIISAIWLYLLLGILLGFLSTMIFPEHFIKDLNYQKVNLVLTPLLLAISMSLIGKMRKKTEKRVVNLNSFSYSYVFALSLALVRYVATQ